MGTEAMDPAEHTELVSDTWVKAGQEIIQHFWRRPLAAVTDAFAGAGFAIERIAEPQPTAADLQKFPGELGQVAGIPVFIVYGLRLTAPAG